MLKPILAVLIIIVILAMAFYFIRSGTDTAGFLALVVALVPLITLLLRPDKPDADK